MKQKTTLFKTIMLAAAMMLGGEAWAADILPNRSATNELFRLERQGDHAKYFISGGSFLKSSGLGDPNTDEDSELTNTWQVNADDRYIGFTLPTGYSFQEGDVITITGGLKGKYSADRGFTLKDAISDVSFSKFLVVESSYKAKKKTTVTYTIAAGDGIIGKSSLYVYRAGENAYVEKVTVTRTGADDLVPEAVSDKTWDFSTLFSSTSDDRSFEASVVNDNLYYAKSTNIKAVSSTKYPRFTSAVSNTLDFTSMANGVAFMVSAGKGVITVYQISDNAPGLYTKSGASATQLTLIAGTKDDETGLTPHYYEYNTDYDTPFAVGRAISKNTYIAKIVVSPNRPIPTVDDLGYTFSSTLPLDFTYTDVEAYIGAYDSEKKIVTLTQVNKVPANTGLFIKGSADNIPVLTGDADDVVWSSNVLKPVASTTTISQTDGDYTNFVLGLVSGTPTFLKVPDAGVSVSAGKAYLQIPTASAPAAPQLQMVFDNGDVTGISSVQGAGLKVNGYYDLQGRKVANPTKGLYIVNGKKVIIK